MGGVSSLISHIVPSLGAPEDDAHAERLLQLCLRIIGSRMAGHAIAQTDAAAAETTRRRLVQAGRAQAALSYTALHSQLTQSADQGGLCRLPGALQLLTSLLGSGTAPLGTAGASAALRARQPPPAPPISLSKGAVQARAPSGDAAAAGAPAPLGAIANGVGPASKGKAKGAPPRKKWEVGASEGEMTERALVRELLFVMQNIDGASLRWDEHRDSFVLPSGAKVPAGARQLAGRLAELGWLFRQITAYVKGRGGGGDGGGVAPAAAPPAGFEGADGGARSEGGLVAQALRHALQEELDEWFQLLAVLEEQRQSELTLLQLLVWSADPMLRLLVMAQLTRGCGYLKGGAMTVAIARQERHGDPAVSGYVRHLLRAACAPLFAMLREWLLHGEITDGCDEFFIEQRWAPSGWAQTQGVSHVAVATWQ